MIKTVNLQKIFKTEEVQTLALNDVNIEVKEGEFVAIMGPSGCGKSTLLNILGLLDNPTSGEYYLNGTEVSKYTEAQRTNLRKGVIGFVFQSFNLIDELHLPVPQAVAMASLNAAVFLDQQDRIGSLRKGKQADFIVVNDEHQCLATYQKGIQVCRIEDRARLANPEFMKYKVA